MKSFKIASSDGIKIVKGEKIKIRNNPCFIFREGLFYNITHLYTGMKMAYELDPINAIIKVKENMKKKPDWHIKGKEALDGLGFGYPINK